MQKVKKTPLRMCIACREMKNKKDLIRIVRSKDGVYSLDKIGKAAGRGAYICNDLECIKKCLKTKALNRAFKENVADEVYKVILDEYEQGQD